MNNLNSKIDSLVEESREWGIMYGLVLAAALFPVNSDPYRTILDAAKELKDRTGYTL